MKRFRYLKPIKTKGIFYNSKNTGGMRAKAKATNTLIYILLGFISLILSSNTSTLLLPIVEFRAIICLFILDSSTLS